MNRRIVVAASLAVGFILSANVSQAQRRSGMKYDVNGSGINRSASNIAFNAGIGADLPLAENIGLRIMAKDYIGKFDVNEATSIDYTSKNSNNVALSAGLKLGF